MRSFFGLAAALSIGCGGQAAVVDASPPLLVTVTAAEPPEIALPAGAELIGEHHVVRADRDARYSPAEPYVLRMAIPSEVSLEEIGLAKLVARSDFLHGGEDGELWMLFDGLVDPTARTLTVPLLSLSAAGERVAVVRHRDFARPAGKLPAPAGFQFHVSCRDFPDPSVCTPEFTAG
jgi:hypothetical protein